MIKNEGLIYKLAPKFTGPYKIVKATENYNYVIADPTNEEFKRTVPRHKLKVIDFSEKRFKDLSEVKKILQHRIVNNQTEYQVRWNNDSIEWVKEIDFNTKEIINEYRNKRVKKRGRPSTKKQVQIPVTPQRKSTRKNHSINNINLVFVKRSNYKFKSIIFILIFLVILSFKQAYALKINSKLPFCDITSNIPIWNEQDECTTSKIDDNKVEHSPFIILSKMHDLVNGDGWQCYKTVHSYEYIESFTWARSKSSEITNVQLKRKDCRLMVETKMCNNNKMVCENSNCWYTPTIKAAYKWWDTVVITEESCKFHPKTIVAKDMKSNLFGTRCLPGIWSVIFTIAL
jgi:hypothetical protein